MYINPRPLHLCQRKMKNTQWCVKHLYELIPGDHKTCVTVKQITNQLYPWQVQHVCLWTLHAGSPPMIWARIGFCLLQTNRRCCCCQKKPDQHRVVWAMKHSLWRPAWKTVVLCDGFHHRKMSMSRFSTKQWWSILNKAVLFLPALMVSALKQDAEYFLLPDYT